MPGKFYVATAIPYVNDKPHIGHALGFLYGDVLARYQRSLGKDVVFSIGTDEHGGKIAQKAASMNLEPRALVDHFSAEFGRLADEFAISRTHFVRTSDPDHCRRVQLAWQRLKDYIYKGSYKGWYCRGCEAYQTETHVRASEGVCPDHQQAYEELEEESYFFKLTALAGRLRQEIESDRLRIVPTGAKTEALNLLAAEQDICISRPAASVSWGIPVPGDASQVMYVWFDAVLNYITILGYPDGEEFKSHWPTDVQIIGRDILRFHAIIYPAYLLGLELPLYRQLYLHGLITVEGQKMSKTLGNVVDPFELIKTYGIDAIRYFLLRHLPAYDNGDFSYKRLTAAYNNELVDQLGNLVHRLQALIWQKLEGRLPASAAAKFETGNLEGEFRVFLEDCRFDQALNLIFAEIKALNRRLEEEQPWHLEGQAASAVLGSVAASLLRLNSLLEPFLPKLSQKIAKVFSGDPIQPVGSPLLAKIKTPADEVEG